MKSKFDASGGLEQMDRPPLKGIPQPPKCPRYGDDSVFYTYSKGPNVQELTLKWPYRNRGKGPTD
jgi:hypothetical protein